MNQQHSVAEETSLMITPTVSWNASLPVFIPSDDGSVPGVLRVQATATLMVAGCFLCIFAAFISSPVLERYNYLTATGLGLIAGSVLSVSLWKVLHDINLCCPLAAACYAAAIVVFVVIDRKYYCFTEEADYHYAFGFGVASAPVAIIASILGFQTPTALLRLWGRMNDVEG